MAAAGMAEADIAGNLARQGFSPAAIDVAMREALKAQITAPPLRPAPPLPRPPAPPPPGPMVPEAAAIPETPTMEFPPAPVPPPPAAPAVPAPAPPPERPRYPTYPPPAAIPPRRPLGLVPPAEVRPEIGVPPERVVPAAARPIEYAAPPTAEEMITGAPPRRVPEAPAEITVEEIVEGIVAEYWSQFEERLDNFEKRDIQLQAQIQDLKKGMAELEDRLKAREADTVTRLEAMGESLTAIQGRIGSIEKVFKDFLPQMTENVRTMAEVVEKLRAGK